MGYAWTGQEPDPLLACDREHCTAEENVPVQRLNCGHSFHKTCLTQSTQCTDHGYSMSNCITCSICSVQLPLRIQELANSFNSGLLSETESNEDCPPDDDRGEDDDGGDDNDDDDGDNGKPVAIAEKILIKAKECLQHLPEATLFKFNNRNCKPNMQTTFSVTASSNNTGFVCETCGRICKSKGGLTNHRATHR